MVLFGSLSRHAREMSPLSLAAPGREPGLVEDIDEWLRRNAQGLCNRHALCVHRRGHASDRVGEAFAIEQEVAIGMLDPSGIHDHALGMEYRVEVRECRLEHAARLSNLRIERLDQCEQVGRLLAGNGGETQPLGIAVDVDDPPAPPCG